MPTSTNTEEFTVGLEATSLHRVNGVVQGRVVLSIGDEQKEIQRITLDSEISRNRAAKGWVKRYGVDLDAVLEKLNSTCTSAIARDIERHKRYEQTRSEAGRVSALADVFVREVVAPEWHRKGRSIYSATAEREIATGALWTLATDNWVDAVGKTQEGLDAGDLDYRGKLGLLREAVAMAVARAIKSLPEYAGVDQDKTVKPAVLRAAPLDELVAWLLTERRFTNDNGVLITTSIYQWAACLEIDGGWRQCYTLAVWGRLDAAAAQPQIAVKGAILSKELRAESGRKLAAGLREHGLAEIDKGIKVAGKNWRVWILTQKSTDAVATAVTGVTP